MTGRAKGTPAGATRQPPRRSQALPSGELRALVLAHLHRYPNLDFSAAELANVLGRPKSRRAINNACIRLVDLGKAIRTQSAPQRCQAATRQPHMV